MASVGRGSPAGHCRSSPARSGPCLQVDGIGVRIELNCRMSARVSKSLCGVEKMTIGMSVRSKISGDGDTKHQGFP